MDIYIYTFIVIASNNHVEIHSFVDVNQIYNDNDGADDDEEEDDDDNNNNVQIFQEVCIDHVGAYVLYAPIATRNMHKILNEENSSDFGILRWGFMISRDGHLDADVTSGSDHHRQKGSLLTLSFQVSVPVEAQLGVTMERLNSIFTITIGKIQTALDCDDDDSLKT
ncbi:hypothetical protein P8452_16850 [Trifolium repens]|nr:hypothetical protein P8452_16850 [Trifolium repens]